MSQAHLTGGQGQVWLPTGNREETDKPRSWHWTVAFLWASPDAASETHLEEIRKVAGQLSFIWVMKTFFFFLAALGLCCCAQAFSSCGEQGVFFVAVHRLLIVVASFVAEHGL